MNTFFAELSRRNVFRVAAAYVIVGWIALQVVSVLMPTLRLPDWMPAVVFTFLLIGFPVAILLTWAFEMTPQGVRKTQGPSDDAPGPTRTDFGLIIIGALVVGVGLFAPMRAPLPNEAASQGAVEMQPDSRTDIADEDTSPLSFTLAVLPFANFSDDKQLGWIADGISEDLLTQLASYPRLALAARNTAFQYKGRSPDLREVGKELSVRYALEGSIRKQGGALRVTAQLIDTATGNHVWAGQFNPALSEIATLHDTVIDAIALEVASTVLTTEFDRLSKIPREELSGIDANHVANKFYVEGNIHEAMKFVEVLRRSDFPAGVGAVVRGYARFLIPYKAQRVAIEKTMLADLREFEEKGPPGAWKEAVLTLISIYVGDTDKAEYHARQSYALAPDYAGSMYALGVSENAQGNYAHTLELGEACIQSVSRIDNFVGLCHQIITEALLGLGRYEEAIEAAHRATRTRRDGFAIIVITAANHGLGNFEAAQKTMAEYKAMQYRFDRRGLEEYIELLYTDMALRSLILEAVDAAGMGEEESE